MILNLIASILILMIGYFQVNQGLFNALILAIVSIVSALAAFSLYEPLTELLGLYALLPDMAEALTLFLTFIVFFFSLRLLSDWGLSGNVVFGLWPDRIFGGLFGLLAGQIIVGVWVICVQMMPFGPSIMMYQPYDNSLQRTTGLLPLYPDEFVLGMTNMFSTGSMKTGEVKSFNSIHDDLRREMFCWRNGYVNENGNYVSQIAAKPSAMAIPSFQSGDATLQGAVYTPPKELSDKWMEELPQNPLLTESEMKGPTKFVVVRTLVKNEASEPPSKDNSSSGWYFLPASHFRLVTRSGRSHYPIAYLAWDSPIPADPRELKPTTQPTEWQAVAAKGNPQKPEIFKLMVSRPQDCAQKGEGKDEGLIVDWVYRLPADENLTPSEEDVKNGNNINAYVAFRRNAKQEIKSIAPCMPPTDGALLLRPMKQ